MARHAISVCKQIGSSKCLWIATDDSNSKGGGVLLDRADQQAVKTFLQHMQQTTSWNTEPMVISLQEQWDEF